MNPDPIKQISYPMVLPDITLPSISVFQSSDSDPNIHPLPPRKKFNSRAANIEMGNVKTSQAEIEAAINFLNGTEELKDLKVTINENLQKSLKRIVRNKSYQEGAKGKFDLINNFFKDQIGLINDYFKDPYQKVFKVFPFKGSEKPEVFLKPFGYVQDAVSAIGTLATGANLLVQIIHYNQAKALLNELKNERLENPADEELLIKIQILKSFLKLQKEQMKQGGLFFTAGFLTSAIVNLLNVKKLIDPVLPTLSTTLGVVAPLIKVMWATISYVSFLKKQDAHKLWMQKGLDQDANKLLIKRQERLILKKISREEFEEEIEQTQLPYDMAVSQICHQLYPVEYDDEGSRLLEPEEMTETMSVTTRNALKVLAEKKSKMEKNGFSFRFLINKLNLSFVCIQASITIILSILTIVGVIALTSSMMAIPGLGFFVLGLVLIAAGIIYLRKKQPNIFNCYVKGVYVKLFFANAAAKIRKLQADRKILNRHKIENRNARYIQLEGLLEKQRNLEDLTIPKELTSLFNRLKKTTSKKVDDFKTLESADQLIELKNTLEKMHLKEDVKLAKAKLEEKEAVAKRDYWSYDEGESESDDGVVIQLKDLLRKAAYKDFMKNNPDIMDENGTLLITEIICDAIVQEKLYLDEDLTLFLKDKMGIDIKNMENLDEDILKKKIRRMLEDYFLKDNEAFTSLIEKSLKPPPPDLEKLIS